MRKIGREVGRQSRWFTVSRANRGRSRQIPATSNHFSLCRFPVGIFSWKLPPPPCAKLWVYHCMKITVWWKLRLHLFERSALQCPWSARHVLRPKVYRWAQTCTLKSELTQRIKPQTKPNYWDWAFCCATRSFYTCSLFGALVSEPVVLVFFWPCYIAIKNVCKNCCRSIALFCIACFWTTWTCATCERTRLSSGRAYPGAIV